MPNNIFDMMSNVPGRNQVQRPRQNQGVQGLQGLTGGTRGGPVTPGAGPGEQLNPPGWSSTATEWNWEDMSDMWSDYGPGLGGMYDAWQDGYFDQYLANYEIIAGNTGGDTSDMEGWEDWSFTDVVNWMNNNPGAPGGGWSQYYPGGTGTEGGGSNIGDYYGDLGQGSTSGVDPYTPPEVPGETYEIGGDPYMEGDKYQEGGPYLPPGGDDCYNQWLATVGVGNEGSYEEFASLYCGS